MLYKEDEIRKEDGVNQIIGGIKHTVSNSLTLYIFCTLHIKVPLKTIKFENILHALKITQIKIVQW